MRVCFDGICRCCKALGGSNEAAYGTGRTGDLGHRCHSLVGVAGGLRALWTVALTKQFPDLEIAVDTVSVSDERVPKAFYQYDCTFDVQRPIYRLDRNALCPAVVAKSEQ